MDTATKRHTHDNTSLLPPTSTILTGDGGEVEKQEKRKREIIAVILLESSTWTTPASSQQLPGGPEGPAARHPGASMVHRSQERGVDWEVTSSPRLQNNTCINARGMVLPFHS